MSVATVSSATGYEVVIGLEVHAQLNTRSKMFCGCASDYFAAPPNTRVCAVCLGMPGVLPVINRSAVDLTILTGLALGCTIPPHSKFDRKNYPYPDLMKGYQISQYDEPLCTGGTVAIELDGEGREIELERIHLEEDTARLLHREGDGGYSLLDVNRSGVPLMEIVSTPDMHSSEEAVAYLRELRRTLRYLNVSDADMGEGLVPLRRQHLAAPSRRSARLEGRNQEHELVPRRAARDRVRDPAPDRRSRQRRQRRAGDARLHRRHRRDRQPALQGRGARLPLLPGAGSASARDREARLADIRARLPELPDAKRERFEREYGLAATEASLLAETRARADAFEAAVAASKPERAPAVARWLIGDVAALLNQAGGDAELADTPLTPRHVAELVGLVEDEVITVATAKQVLAAAFESGDTPAAIVEARGLAQLRDDEGLARIAAEVIDANAQAVADYRGGKESAIKFLVGQVMRATRGRADPNEAQSALRSVLDG